MEPPPKNEDIDEVIDAFHSKILSLVHQIFTI